MSTPDERALDARIDALFAGPPGEFTAARDALARELRGSGRRDDAAAVAALRRPSRTADALNRLAREDPARLSALLEAVDGLAAAQERMRDAGDAGALHASAAAEAAALAAFPGGPDLINALRFSARSPATRDDLRRGRLVREAEPDTAAGPFGMAPAGPATPPRARLRVAPAPAPDPAPDEPAPDPPAPDPAQAAARAERIAAVTTALDSAREDDRAARARREQAEREADDAADEALSLRAEAERLRAEASAAEAAATEQDGIAADRDAARHAARDDERGAAEALAAARETARALLEP